VTSPAQTAVRRACTQEASVDFRAYESDVLVEASFRDSAGRWWKGDEAGNLTRLTGAEPSPAA